MFRKLVCSILITVLLSSTVGPKATAGSLLDLPRPGTMVYLSPAYNPVIIKGLTIHKDNPFLFDFIVDVGQDKLQGQDLKTEGEKLIKYFFASLTVPEKDLWVNLSPYEKGRIIPEELSKTEMGRDLLAEDYILKQITASLIYPERQLGKVFWDNVYSKAQKLYGTTQIPVNTFNKVWIMADRAEVFEHNQTVFVTDSHLKVMLEEDYLALKKHTAVHTDTSPIGANIVRAIILPALENEVNTGKNFANLRQIFNSLILASWYKKNLKNAFLNQVYSNKSTIKGIDLKDPRIKEQIYRRYLQAYKKGVFNYIKEDINKADNTTITRKYFSGGMQIVPKNLAMTSDPSRLSASLHDTDKLVLIRAGTVITNAGAPMNMAMTAREQITPDQKKMLAAALTDTLAANVTSEHKEGYGLITESKFASWSFSNGNEIRVEYPGDSRHIFLFPRTVLIFYTFTPFLAATYEYAGDLTGVRKEDMKDLIKAMINDIDRPHTSVVNHQKVKFVLDVVTSVVISVAVLYALEFVSQHLLKEHIGNAGRVAIIGISSLVVAIVRTKKRSDRGPGKLVGSFKEGRLDSDHAMNVENNGGIDLDTANGMKWSVRKDGTNVEMNINPVLIQRIRQEGIGGLRPVIFRIIPFSIANVWSLVLQR